MPTYLIIVCVLGIEIIVFFAEVLFSSLDIRNRILIRVNTLDTLDFIDLEKGYRTTVSFFRISMFVAYVILVILLIDKSTAENSLEELMLYLFIGI